MTRHYSLSSTSDTHTAHCTFFFFLRFLRPTLERRRRALTPPNLAFVVLRTCSTYEHVRRLCGREEKGRRWEGIPGGSGAKRGDIHRERHRNTRRKNIQREGEKNREQICKRKEVFFWSSRETPWELRPKLEPEFVLTLSAT